jgi:hypothetical protein
MTRDRNHRTRPAAGRAGDNQRSDPTVGRRTLTSQLPPAITNEPVQRLSWASAGLPAFDTEARPEVAHQIAPGEHAMTEVPVVQHSESADASYVAMSGSLPMLPRPAAASAPANPVATLQMLFGGPRTGTASAKNPAHVHAVAARGTATSATKLPHFDRIQRAFGRHDVSSVKAHTGADAAASTREMGARAYATNDHVVLGEGADLHAVAHEAAHVVQQRGGVHLDGGVGEVGDAYEQHADAIADRVVRGESAEQLLGEMAAPRSRTSTGTVQRLIATAGLPDEQRVVKQLKNYNAELQRLFTLKAFTQREVKSLTAMLRKLRDNLIGQSTLGDKLEPLKKAVKEELAALEKVTVKLKPGAEADPKMLVELRVERGTMQEIVEVEKHPQHGEEEEEEEEEEGASSRDEVKALDNEKEAVSTPPSTPPRSPRTPQPSRSRDLKGVDLVNDFNVGDKIYGLKDERKKYVDALREHWEATRKEKLLLVTMDEINNAYFSRVFEGDQMIVDVSAKKETGDKSADKEAHSYLELLNLKYSEKGARSEKSFPMQEEDALNRSCKTGLELFRVHFVLDGITAEDVGNKNTIHGQGFTSKELRSVIRRINKGEKLDNVIFYREGQRVDASTMEAFFKQANYQPTKKSK